MFNLFKIVAHNLNSFISTRKFILQFFLIVSILADSWRKQAVVIDMIYSRCTALRLLGSGKGYGCSAYFPSWSSG